MLPSVLTKLPICKTSFTSLMKNLDRLSKLNAQAPKPSIILLQCRSASYTPRSYTVIAPLRNFGVLNGSRNNFRSTPAFLYQCKTLVTKTPQGIQESVSALQMKKRPIRKKRAIAGEEETVGKPGFGNVMAYATAEEYDLERLVTSPKLQELYNPSMLSDNPDLGPTTPADLDVVHATARYPVGDEPREIFFFREGTTVFWNMTELECNNVLLVLRAFEHNSYDDRLVQEECDIMPYSYSETGQSHLANGSLLLAPEQTTLLDKYTFSNAMALSVKLGVWEASLDRYVDSIGFVVEDLKRGNKINISQEEVLRKTGELFALRHLINLSSDLLDTPDFYWDREVQEALYLSTCSYFSIQRRTKVMNEKLNHCVELVELLSSHLSDRHHVRLEWMIIVLIMVEVVFEILHFLERYV